MNKTEYLNVRLTPMELSALRQLQAAYELPTKSAAVRRAIRAVAAERGLDAGVGRQGRS